MAFDSRNRFSVLISKKKTVFLFLRYYDNDRDVQEDSELQAYANELSINGTGPNGGIGRVSVISWLVGSCANLFIKGKANILLLVCGSDPFLSFPRKTYCSLFSTDSRISCQN